MDKALSMILSGGAASPAEIRFLRLDAMPAKGGSNEKSGTR